MLSSLTEVFPRASREGSTHSNLVAQPLASFKRLQSEAEIRRTEVEKMTMIDEPYVFSQFQV